MRAQSVALAAALASAAAAQQSVYGQCGGTGWSGATTCAAGSTCVMLNPYYSQCQPGVASSTLATSTVPATTTRLPATTAPSTTRSPTSSGGAPAPSGAGAGTTLQSGYYWIRAVEDPNFHKYLQTDPEYTTGTAILGDPTSAGQFNIVDGQLVELVDAAAGTLLYATVTPASDASQTKLAVTFTTTKNTYGTFAFQGDTVTWSVAGTTRPNNGAWLVCADQALFVNLGSYGYMTPAGCADETIHSYGGSTANA
ncbi:MAG: hypothetical protein Q9162_007703 [Coniocarpon cinnabarinum]